MNRRLIAIAAIACLGIAFLAGTVFLKLFEDNSSTADKANNGPTVAAYPSWETSSQNNYSPAHGTTDNNEMRSEIESLKATVAELQSEIRKNGKSQINVATERAVNSSMDSEDSELSMEENALTMDENELDLLRMEEEYQFFSQVENNFYSEPIDYSWSSSMTDRIESALNSEAASDLNIDYMECRSSMCRLEISTTGSSVDLEAFKLDFRDQLSDVLTSGAVQQDETGKMIVYLGRDNEAFGVFEPTY